MAKLCGDHAVSQLLKSQMPVHCLYVESGKDKLYGKMIQHARANHIPVKIVNQLSKVFPGSRHQGIGAEFEYQWAKLSDLEVRSNSRFLMLDRVQDPHNFGACLRSAAAFGVDAVIIPTRGHAPMNEIVHQTSCGGSLIVPIVSVNNLSQAMTEMKDQGVWFIATSEHAESTLSEDLHSRALCLLMGSEGEGVKQKLFDACDYQVKIHTTGTLATLNVSVATAILLHTLQV